jgi:hypothetical protein
MDNTELIRSQIRSLEAQLRVLEARINSSSPGDSAPGHSFAELYGRLKDLADSTEEEIDEASYQLPDTADDK